MLKGRYMNSPFIHYSLKKSLVCIVCIIYSLLFYSAQTTIAAPDTNSTPSTEDARALTFEWQDTAVAITSDGQFVHAYYDLSTQDLILDVHPTPLTSIDLRNTTTIDATNEVGKQVDIDLTSTNAVVMSYLDETNGNLKYAYCTIPCRTPTVTAIVDTVSGLSIGYHSDIEVMSDGLAVITHKDYDGNYLLLTTCRNTSCTNNNTISIARPASSYTDIAMAITSDDKPIIAYAEAVDGDTNNHQLNLIFCGNRECSSSNTVLIDENGNAGHSVDIVLGAYNEPFVSYVEYGTSRLKLATCRDISNCMTSMIVWDYSKFGVQGVSDTAIDLHYVAAYQYRPVIVYYDSLSDLYRFITCSNAKCDTITLSSSQYAGGYGISLAIRDNKTISGHYYNAVNVGLYVDDTYPLGTSSLSGGYLIRAGEKPKAFNKVLPTNNKILTTNSVILKANYSSLAESFEYCFATSAAACTNWAYFDTYTGATKTGLIHNQTYYWQVRAKNRIGTTLANNGTVWQFKVVVPPAAFTKSAPTNNAIRQRTSITLSWAASTRATSYEYCIALTTATCTTWKSTGTARTATVTGLAKNKAYFWQVRAKNAGGTISSTGPHWKFTTAP